MRSLSRFGLPIVVAALVGICAYAATGDSQSGTWTTVGETSAVRANAATALLYDGRVLVTGGRSADGLLRSAELFTPDAGFSAARAMQSARSGHAAVALFDGRVLVTGGVGADGMAMNSAETYDPWTGTWQALSSSMTEPRAGHTATLLDDGRVLIAGGDVAGVPSSTFEVFDPSFDAFRAAGILSAPRTFHAATLLPDGRVMIAGGTDGNVALASIDVVDADAGWVAQAMMATGRFGLTATTLLDGRVLLAGGSTLKAELASTELYDPATGSVTAGAPLTQARTGHLAFRLPNNNAVLVAGGSIAGTSLGSSELYYPWSDVWSASGSLNTLKSASTGTPLAVTGQLLAASSAESALAETYHFATVATDSDDYAPGETVTISGSGWQPGETVTLSLHEDPDIDEHAALTAVADGLGNFTNADFAPDVHDLNVRFTLTAKGAASEAQMTFTDANPNPASDGDGSMVVAPTSVTSGTTNNLSFTFTGDNNKGFDAGSQVRLTIPSGWTAPQNANASAPGYVTVLNSPPGTACQSASITTVTPTSVTLTIACDNKKTFALSYAQVTAPTVGAATPYTFTTETRIPSGTFKATDLAQQPHPSPQVTVNPVSCTSPSVTTNPTNQTVTYGGSATFTAAASGNPAPTVQWQVNTGSGFTNIAGATATTLTVTTPSVSANGNRYQAVFTSSCNGTQTATTSPATLTVNTALLTVTADDKSRQYGTDNPAFTATISGFVNGEGLATSGMTGSAAFTTSATASSAVGGYAVVPALGTLAAVNYSFTFANGTLTINKAPITVTADAKTKTYGDADPALTSQVTSGTLATGDTFTGALSRDAGENVGGYAIIQGTLALSSNYTLTYVGANLQITSRAVTVTADTKTKTYGDVDPALTYLVTSGSLATGDSFGGALARATGQSVGTYAITQGTLALSTNYTLSYVGANLTITARPITVTAEAQTKVYGDADPAPLPYHVTSGNLVNTDSFSGTLTRAAGEGVGPYPITQGSLVLSANYALSYVGATLTITARPITVTADGKTKVYGDADPTLTYQTSVNLVPGDSFTGALARAAGEAVGTHAIDQGTLALSTNYALSYVGATLTITARPITVTADGKTKVYGDADPTLTYQTSVNLVPGDSFTGALARAAGEAVGTHAIDQGTLALSTNYALSYVGANLTITARPITVTADAKTKVYGDADPALTYQVTVGTLVGSDAFSGALARATGEAVGSYAVDQGTLALSTNYALSYVGATLTITARPITVTADAKTKVYGDADPALTYQVTVGTLVGSDAFSGALARATGEAVGSYAVDQGTLALSTNYALSYVGANLTITARPITVTADAKTKVYGDADPALTYQVTVGTLVGSDAFGGALVRTTGQSVGTYAIGQGTLALSSNYALTYSGANLTITPATPSIVVTGGPFTYDGNQHPAVVSVTGVGNAVVSGSLTVTYNNSSSVPIGAGTYAVGVTFVSGDANYKNASGAGTLLINKANQTVTLAGVPAAVTLGEGPFTVSASASSSLPVQITVSGSCSFSGSSLSITGPGACTVSANQAGNSNYYPAPEVVRTFNTVVSWSDLLQPINIDGSSIFKYSSTIPVKFRLTGASAGIGNLVARIMVARVSSQAIGSELEAVSTSAADAGNTFRYDPTAGQYIFNLSTKLTGMTQGTWQILINLGDGVVHTVLISTRN